MSLGFTPQPLLSAPCPAETAAPVFRVAGVYTPAFVERLGSVSRRPARGCVAGVYTPAFVERLGSVSRRPARGCVAGVYTPAFVERPNFG